LCDPTFIPLHARLNALLFFAALVQVSAVPPAAIAASRKASAAAEFSQRMQRDQRFKKASVAGGRSSVVAAPEPAPVPVPAAALAVEVEAGAAKRSPTRSPLMAIQANSPARALAVEAGVKGASKPPAPAPGHRPGAADDHDRKHATFAPSADAENAAPDAAPAAAPAPLKPRARVVSARNVVSARLTTQASQVLAAHQAATDEQHASNAVNPHAGSYISRLRHKVIRG